MTFGYQPSPKYRSLVQLMRQTALFRSGRRHRRISLSSLHWFLVAGRDHESSSQYGSNSNRCLLQHDPACGNPRVPAESAANHRRLDRAPNRCFNFCRHWFSEPKAVPLALVYEITQCGPGRSAPRATLSLAGGTHLVRRGCRPLLRQARRTLVHDQSSSSSMVAQGRSSHYVDPVIVRVALRGGWRSRRVKSAARTAPASTAPVRLRMG
jgi:hypothetical protein